MTGAIPVTHSSGTYPVSIAPGTLRQLHLVAHDRLGDRRLALIADTTVHTLYHSGRWGEPSWEGETLTVAPGEDSKTRETWGQLTDELLARRFGRDSGLIGLGGGVIGDLTGFVAATYLRGIPYLLVPTTLLAMIDASIGGKTGVNTPHGKNLIGAFHPPAGVLADPLVLQTLPDREYRGGLAEAVKHGLIADARYFEWMESAVERILAREPDTVTHLVRRSVEIKAAVVSEDEHEKGRRAILNAGHTVGHALEQASQYRLSHGEAVSLGLVAECALAERMSIAAPGMHTRVERLLSRFGLPTRGSSPLDLDSLLRLMGSDKKNRKRRVHFAPVQAIGSMSQDTGWTLPADEADLEAALRVLKPT